ncbi:MAG: 50S ribosomal protein L31 [Candidatus Saccharimonadales bacterium]
MKKDIHPEYVDATITCNGCGNSFNTRATTSKIEVEICSNCHPFYTGKQKLVDVAGRVDRFRAKQAAAGKKAKSKSKQATKKQGDNTNKKTGKKSNSKKSLADLKN